MFSFFILKRNSVKQIQNSNICIFEMKEPFNYEAINLFTYFSADL